MLSNWTKELADVTSMVFTSLFECNMLRLVSYMLVEMLPICHLFDTVVEEKEKLFMLCDFIL